MLTKVEGEVVNERSGSLTNGVYAPSSFKKLPGVVAAAHGAFAGLPF
jgi:hypothetical protein